MKNFKIILITLSGLLISSGCANIKLVSSENNKIKLCTNSGNQIASESYFDKEAARQCGGGYRRISNGKEFFSDPKNPKIAGFIEVQTERRMCYVYECDKN